MIPVRAGARGQTRALKIAMAVSLSLSFSSTTTASTDEVELVLEWKTADQRPLSIRTGTSTSFDDHDIAATDRRWAGKVAKRRDSVNRVSYAEASVFYGASYYPLRFGIPVGEPSVKFDISSVYRNCNPAGIAFVRNTASGVNAAREAPGALISLIRMHDRCSAAGAGPDALLPIATEAKDLICRYGDLGGVLDPASIIRKIRTSLPVAERSGLDTCRREIFAALARRSNENVAALVLDSAIDAQVAFAAVRELEEVGNSPELAEIFAQNGFDPDRQRGELVRRLLGDAESSLATAETTLIVPGSSTRPQLQSASANLSNIELILGPDGANRRQAILSSAGLRQNDLEIAEQRLEAEAGRAIAAEAYLSGSRPTAELQPNFDATATDRDFIDAPANDVTTIEEAVIEETDMMELEAMSGPEG